MNTAMAAPKILQFCSLYVCTYVHKQHFETERDNHYSTSGSFNFSFVVYKKLASCEAQINSSKCKNSNSQEEGVESSQSFFVEKYIGILITTF